MTEKVKRYSIVMIAVLSLLLHFGIGVQDVYGSNSDLGFKFGAQRLNDSVEFSYKLGLFYGIELNEDFVIQPELYYSQFGNQFSGGLSEYDLQRVDRLRYLEVPLLIKYKIPLGGDFRPMVMAGVYGAIRLSKGEIGSDVQPSRNESTNVFYTGTLTRRTYESFEGGLVIGAGVEHGKGKTRMTFDVRMNIGLNDYARFITEFVQADGNISPNKGINTHRTSSLTLSLGISF